MAEVAIAPAHRLAGLLGASIRFLTVMVPNSDEAEASAYVRAAAARAGIEPADVEVIASNATATEIVRSAEGRGDLVCMTTHGRSRWGELLLGSISEAVIARSPSPVLLVGPAADVDAPADGPVLVPLDGSVTASGALGPAVAWAAALGVGLHLVHASGSTGDDAIDAETLIRGAESVAGPAGVAVTAEVVRGHPASWVVAAARDRRATVMVLTSRGATAGEDRTLSKVARQIVRDAPVPVLVVPHHH